MVGLPRSFKPMPNFQISEKWGAKATQKINKASGPDEIVTRTWRAYADQLAEPLIFIFSKFLVIGNRQTWHLFLRKLENTNHQIIDLFHQYAYAVRYCNRLETNKILYDCKEYSLMIGNTVSGQKLGRNYFPHWKL